MQTEREGAALAGRMAEQRRGKRSAALLAEGAPDRILERVRGRPYVGRDENGQPVQTRRPEDLRMRVDGTRVRISFYKKDMEGLRRYGPPRKEVSTDIFSGVRMFMHIRGNYGEEFARRDALLQEMEWINAQIYGEGLRMSAEQLTETAARLKEIQRDITRQNARSKNAAWLKLDDVFAQLEKAAGCEGRERRKALDVVCGRLVAFRNRYGEWRDREAARVLGYNMLREYSLRQRRDVLVAGMLDGWAKLVSQKGLAIAASWKRDQANAEKLAGVMTMLSFRNQGYMEAACITLKGVGRTLNPKRNNDFEEKVKELLRGAYRMLHERNADGAMKKMQEAFDVLVGNKPWHVANQLNPTDAGTMEFYLGGAVADMRKACRRLIDERDPQASAELFRQAARKLA